MASQLIGKVVGPPGADGQDGQDGTSAVITGATATASGLTPGSTPTVTVTAGGTSSSRSFAFAFGIPAGAKGDPGDDGQDGQDGPNRVTSETATTLTGILKGNGSTITTATAGTDYGTYSKPAGGIPTSDLASVDSAPDASHDNNLISSAAVAKQVLWYSGQAVSAASGAQICRVPASGTDSKITADHVVSEAVFANPQNITSSVTWQTYAGYVVFTGTCTASTTVTFQLSKKGN